MTDCKATIVHKTSQGYPDFESDFF